MTVIELAATHAAARIGLLLLVFAVVALAAFALLSSVSRRLAFRSQLQKLAAERQPIAHVGQAAASLRSRVASGTWARLVARVEATGLNLDDTKSERLSAKLKAAGFTSPAAPRIFTLIRLGMIILLPLLYLLSAYSGGEPPSLLRLYLFGSLFALLGLYLPNLVVQARADRRRQAVVNGFPDCLDLMLVCVESGLGIEAAIERVGREIVLSHPLIAELFSMASLQTRAGSSREDAFRKLAETAGVDEIRSFTTLLIQSDRLGTSIATTLRIYAAEMREKRRMRAEEKAHRLPVLISIPLVACMLPTMIGVLMLPAAVNVVRVIMPQLNGGR